MCRLWGVSFALLAALLVLPPWWLGQRAEQAYTNLLHRLERQGLRVEQSRYTRGWWNGQADSLLSLAGDAQPGYRLRLRSEVRHGPLDWNSGPHWLAASALTRVSLQRPGAPGELQNTRIKTRVDLRGNILLTFVPADTDPTTLPTLRGELRLAQGMSGIAARLRLAAFEQQHANGLVWRQGPLQIDMHAQRGAAGLYLGELRAELDSLTLRTAAHQGDGLELQSFRLQSHTGTRRGKLWSRTSAQAHRLAVGQRDYHELALNLDLEGLSASVLGRLVGIADELASDRLNSGNKGLALMGLVLSNMQRLLAAGPRLNLQRFSMQTEQGPVDADLQLSFTGLDARRLLDPAAWLNSLQAQGQVELPKELLQALLALRADSQLRQWHALRHQTDPDYALPTVQQRRQAAAVQAGEQLQMLLRQGFAMHRAGQVSTRFHLNAGVLRANGKTVPL